MLEVWLEAREPVDWKTPFKEAKRSRKAKIGKIPHCPIKMTL